MSRDVTELNVVLAVARRRGFRAAALELAMSTTAVSNAVAGLEARLGIRLFHRTTRSVSLTEAGRQFVERIGPAVAEIRLAMDEASGLSAAPSGTLRINCALGAALMTFTPVLHRYLQRFPDVTLDIVTEGRMVDIVGEGFDAGIRVSHSVPQDMIRVPISREIPLAVVASAAYFDRHSPPQKPEDLMHHRCIRGRLPGGLPSGWQFVRHGEEFTLHVPGPLILDSPQLMLSAVRHDAGIAQIPRWYIENELRDGTLVSVLTPWLPPLPGLSLYYAGRRHIPIALQALIDLIHEVNQAD
nr:LysR family transcriptional regulator [uncultured Erwinia sp.]